MARLTEFHRQHRVIIIVREHGHISPHVVHNHSEPLEHGIYGLAGEMSEVLVLSPVGRK
jgi:hypothetical protein